MYNKIEQLGKTEEPLVPSDFGNYWLGCLITILGGNWKEIHCRGSITCSNMNDDVLSIDTETAWGEMDEVRHFIEKVYPALKIYYYEEECGCEIYQTNDKDGQFFPERYILDDLDGEGPEYYDDIDSLLVAASEIFGKKLRTMADLEEIIENSDDYSLHCINVVDD